MADERRPRRDRGIELDAVALQRRLATTPRAPNGRPQEFDEAGFPIPQRMPSFSERVRKLLTG